MYKYKVKWNNGTEEQEKEFEYKEVAEFFIKTLPASSSPTLIQFEQETKKVFKGYEITFKKYDLEPFDVSSKDLDNFPIPKKVLNEDDSLNEKEHIKAMKDIFNYFSKLRKGF